MSRFASIRRDPGGDDPMPATARVEVDYRDLDGITGDGTGLYDAGTDYNAIRKIIFEYGPSSLLHRLSHRKSTTP